jgi:adenylosuccinate synthase
MWVNNNSVVGQCFGMKVGRGDYRSEVVNHGLEVGNTMNVNWRRFGFRGGRWTRVQVFRSSGFFFV